MSENWKEIRFLLGLYRVSYYGVHSFLTHFSLLTDEVTPEWRGVRGPLDGSGGTEDPTDRGPFEWVGGAENPTAGDPRAFRMVRRGPRTP